MKVFIKPLIFVLVLLGLSGIAYWDEKLEKSEAKLKLEKNRIFNFKSEDIVKLGHIQTSELGQSTEARLDKQGGKWSLTVPLSFPGDGESVDSLIKSIVDLQYERIFEANDDKLKEFGLDQPKVSVQLTDQAGHVTSILLGGKSPTGSSTYLKVASEPKIYLVGQYFAAAMSKELRDFRDKSLHVPLIGEIKAVGYQFENQEILTLSRIAEDWLIESPQKFKADSSEVSSFLSFFSKQAVEKFIDAPSPMLRKALSGEQAGTRKLATLVLTGKDGKLTTYALLENNEQVYTTLPGYNGIVMLEKKIKDGLKKTIVDFQYRNMFSYNSTQAIEIERDGKLFQKRGEHWVAKEDEAEADQIKQLLVDYEFAKADRVLSKEEAEVKFDGSPFHVVKISFKDGKKVDFSIWKLGEGTEGLAIKTSDNGFFLANSKLLEGFEIRAKTSLQNQKENEG